MSKKTILELYGVQPQTGRDVGIEIEVEGKNFHMARDPDKWICTHDGSLRGDYGAGQNAEYVLAAPIPRGKVATVLKSLQAYLKEAGAVLNPSSRCGVHVHINCQHMTNKEVINFVSLYLILEDLLVKFCGEDREGNLFCLRARDAEGLIDALVLAVQKDSLTGLQNDNYRYASVNLSAIKKYGSVEFRAMRTPKDFEIINTWISLLLSVYDKAAEHPDIANLIEGISHQGADRFLDQVFGKQAALLDCNGKDELLMEGVRRVQDIAYASRFKKKEAVVPKFRNECNAEVWKLYIQAVRGWNKEKFEWNKSQWAIHGMDYLESAIGKYPIGVKFVIEGYDGVYLQENPDKDARLVDNKLNYEVLPFLREPVDLPPIDILPKDTNPEIGIPYRTARAFSNTVYMVTRHGDFSDVVPELRNAPSYPEEDEEFKEQGEEIAALQPPEVEQNAFDAFLDEDPDRNF